MADSVEKRKLSELRVVDLKQELEKRGKDGNGVKNVLIDRLTQVRQTFCLIVAILDSGDQFRRRGVAPAKND